MNKDLSARQRQGSLWLVLLGLALVWAFNQMGDRSLAGHVFDLGSLNFPAPRYRGFLAGWVLFGLLATAALAAGLTPLIANSRWSTALPRLWMRGSDRTWMIVGSLAALAIALIIRKFVLLDAPIADDESAYQFSAEVLAAGRLWADSPPAKLFFDRQFMVNNGRLYSQYFLGWPALMAPFVWIGIPGLANAVYSALTLPAIFLIARRFGGSGAARLATLIYLTSPMLMAAAATQMSHTTVMGAAAWMLWFALRTRDPDSKPSHHAGVALAFGLAFFVRPLSALGLGLPVLVYWLIGAWRQQGARRIRSAVAFALPALLMAGLFLTVNWVQNGSPSKVAYAAAQDYAEQNDYRFTTWKREGRNAHPIQFRDAGRWLGGSAIALLRLNVAMFGWPCSLLLALFAWGRRETGLLWSIIGCFFLVNLPTQHVGIDAFGPAHYTEVALPFIILSVVGVTRMRTAIGRMTEGQPTRWTAWHPLLPSIVVALLVALALFGYTPARLNALHTPATKLAATFGAPQRSGVTNAVVFAPTFVTPMRCTQWPTRHSVFFRPNNDPKLTNDVLWVNHIDARTNSTLMKRVFPNRQGWVLTWQRCRPRLLPLKRFVAFEESFTRGLTLKRGKSPISPTQDG